MSIYHAEFICAVQSFGELITDTFIAFNTSCSWAYVTWDQQSQRDLLINKKLSQWKQLGYDWIQQEHWLCMYVWLMLIRRRRCELKWILICVYGEAHAIKWEYLAGNDSWVTVLDMLNAISWFSTSSAQSQWDIFINSRKRNGWLRSRVITCQMYVGGTTGWSHKMPYYFWCQSVKDIKWTEMNGAKRKKERPHKQVQYCIWCTIYLKHYDEVQSYSILDLMYSDAVPSLLIYFNYR